MKTKITLSFLLFSFFVAFSQDEFDMNFGDNGIFIQPDISFGATEDIAFQGEDKIIGGSYLSLGSGALLRYVYRINLDGTLDTSFANDGVFTDDSTILINAPGALVVEGDYIYTVSSPVLPNTTRTEMTITRLTAEGELDVSFGIDGYASIPVPDGSDFSEGIEMKINSDGDIIAVGTVRPAGTNYEIFIVAKFLSDGTIDAGFGDNGIYQYPFTEDFDHSISGVFLNEDDSITVIGDLIDRSSGYGYLTVFKLTPEGIIDADFAENGFYTTTDVPTISRSSSGSTHLEDDSIIIYGLEVDQTTNEFRGFSTRIDVNGALDTSFGDSGYAIGFNGEQDIIVNYAQMIPVGDQYVLIGDVLDLGPFVRRIIVTKLYEDGTPVTEYGDNGTKFFDSTISEYNSLRGINAIASGDDFYVACSAGLPSNNIQPAIAKLVNTPLSTTDFDILSRSISLFPNPVNNSTAIQFESKTNQSLNLSIVNVLGQSISSRLIETQIGVNEISLQAEILNLTEGVYTVNLISKDGYLVSMKFIK